MHMTLYAIATRAHIEHDTRDLKARAGALKKHWHQYAVRDEFEPPFEDRPVPPLLLKPDDDDDDDDGTTAWTLRLTAEQAARAQREYRRVREMKARALSYFRHHTPMPMAWRR